MALNKAQKDVLKAAIRPCIRGIQEKLMTRDKSLSRYLTALKCILPNQITVYEQALMEEWEVWFDIRELRQVFVHPAPQNDVYVSKGLQLSDDCQDEVSGLFSLTKLNDGNKVSRDDVTTYMHTRVVDIVQSIERSGVEAIILEEDEWVLEVEGMPQRLVGASILSYFLNEMTAQDFLALSQPVRRTLYARSVMVRSYLDRGMDITQLVRRIEERILKEKNIYDFVTQYDQYYELIIEMSDEVYTALLKVMHKKSNRKFLYTNHYFLERLETAFQWERFGKLLNTWYASIFMVSHIYMVEHILKGSQESFKYILAVFNSQPAYEFLARLFSIAGIYKEMKINQCIPHLFMLLGDSRVSPFIIDHDVLVKPLVSMSDTGILKAMELIKDRRMAEYIHFHPEQLKEEKDLDKIKNRVLNPDEFELEVF